MNLSVVGATSPDWCSCNWL